MENFTTSDYIDVTVAFLTMCGLIFSGIQLFLINSNRRKQYKQLRREKTAEMIMYYSQQITKETKYKESIVLSLNDDQCIDLYNCTPFIIDEKTKKKLCSICPHKIKCRKNNHKNELCKKDGRYYISDSVLYDLRGSTISYLNALESVLLTWELGIVERPVIEEQFSFLDKKRKKERALETFRTIAGSGHSYPAIEKFYQHLDLEASKKAEKSLKKILK